MASMPVLPEGKRARMLALIAVLVIVGLLASTLAYERGWRTGGEEGAKPKPPALEPPYVLTDGGFDHPAQDAMQGSNEPTIAVSTTDPMNIVGGSNDYATPTSDAWCGYYWSFDGGKRWERGLIPGYPNGPVSVLTGYEAAGDPVVMSGPNGEFYFAGIAFKRSTPNLGRSSGIFVAKSTDGGRTFGQVSMVTRSFTALTFHDKEWMAVDQSNGNVYVTWTLFNGPVSQIVFSKSTDGGGRFTQVPKVLTEIRAREFQNQGSQVVVDRKGTIHVTWIDYRSATEGVNRYTSSSDGGDTWSTPVDICSVTYIADPLPNNGYRTPTMEAFAVDNTGGPYDGSIYLVWPDQRTGDADILMVSSHDNGATWSPEPVRVNDDDRNGTADQFFPAVCVAGNGTVVVTFYDRRDDPKNTLLMYYMAQSVDGGATFLPNIPVSEKQSDGNAGGGRRKGGVFSGTPFMGDYTGVAASKGFVVAIWCDTRNGTPDQPNSDIYVARVTIAAVKTGAEPS